MLGLLLQASSPAPGGQYGTFILIGGFIVIFYFFMIRPQQKKQKEQKKFIDEIKKGDQVVTMGGIHGKVAGIEGDTISLEVDRSTKIKVEKSSVSLEASRKYTDAKK
jgi:preprotein translocase subunit YajC